jgi:uncharacterized repeat protein (TIGR04052 family)
MYLNNPLLLLVAASSILLSACSDDDTAATGTAAKDVAIQFAAKINGADFNCGQTYPNVGSGSHDYKVNDFRMYLHEAHIHDDATGNTYPIELTQDGTWQLDDVAMLDFEDNCSTNGTPELNTQVRGSVSTPATVDLTATEVCFTLGLPADKNHIDSATAESPLNASSMLWAWQVGRKYIRIDGFGDPTTTNMPFNLHLGAQGCPGSSPTAPPDSACTVPNTVEVCIDNFNVASSVVAVDPGFVFEANDVSVNLNGGPTARPGCMSFIDDDDCKEIMPRLGLSYDYGLTTGTAPSTYAAGQKLFSKE